MNEREAIGGNNPPSMIAVCDSVAEDISAWLAEHPVITTETMAKDAKLQLDRGKLSLKDMEDERDKAVRPLNERVKFINECYRPTKVILSKIIEEIGARVTAFIQAEEAKRIAAAREAARIAAEADAKAREAERLERDARDSANAGELGINLSEVSRDAGVLAKEADRAARAAAIAERETQVKVTGGFSRATSLRKVKTYHIVDGLAAIRALYPTDDIKAAILKAAKDYHAEYGEVPPGIEMREERKI